MRRMLNTFHTTLFGVVPTFIGIQINPEIYPILANFYIFSAMQPVVNSFNKTTFFQLFEHTKLKTLGKFSVDPYFRKNPSN